MNTKKPEGPEVFCGSLAEFSRTKHLTNYLCVVSVLAITGINFMASTAMDHSSEMNSGQLIFVFFFCLVVDLILLVAFIGIRNEHKRLVPLKKDSHLEDFSYIQKVSEENPVVAAWVKFREQSDIGLLLADVEAIKNFVRMSS